MLSPWNDSSILPPPVLTSCCRSIEDVKDLIHACNEMHRVLQKQSPLHSESAILYRLVYKFDKKFRNDIGYRNFKKVNTALQKYMKLNFLKDVENFQMVLPSEDSDEIYLPSRQMLEYLLTRLQTFSKIMLRIYVCSKLSATFYLDRIKRGESHWMSLMPYAVLCRIWSISSVLLNHSCQWYRNLYKNNSKLEPKGLPFLPQNYKLPEDLGEWLEIQNIEDFGRRDWAVNTAVQVLPELIAIDDSEPNFDIFQYVNEINADSNENHNKLDVSYREDQEESVHQTTSSDIHIGKAISRSSFNKEDKCLKTTEVVHKVDKKQDLGQAISRDLFTKNNPFNNIKKTKLTQETKPNHSTEDVTSSATLEKFLEKEEEYRNDNSSLSLTQHLSFMQWQALKNSLLKLCDALSNNRKVQRKFEKIWKQKCLDYC